MEDASNPRAKHLIDHPSYDSTQRVPFPPSEEDGTGGSVPRAGRPQGGPGPKADYYESYDPDPQTPQPAATTPGAPNLRDPATRLGDDQLRRLSPDIEPGKGLENP